MKISEIYDYLKLNGVKQLGISKSCVYVEHILIVNLEHAWLNVDFAEEHFTTKPHDTKPTKDVTSSDLDRFISEYKYFYSDDRIRDQKIAKLQSAIIKHRYREAVKQRIKIGPITVNGTEVLQND
jgi:hypothetical protein